MVQCGLLLLRIVLPLLYGARGDPRIESPRRDRSGLELLTLLLLLLMLRSWKLFSGNVWKMCGIVFL